jgi:hypothetical protein
MTAIAYNHFGMPLSMVPTRRNVESEPRTVQVGLQGCARGLESLVHGQKRTRA